MVFCRFVCDRRAHLGLGHVMATPCTVVVTALPAASCADVAAGVFPISGAAGAGVGVAVNEIEVNGVAGAVRSVPQGDTARTAGVA